MPEHAKPTVCLPEIPNIPSWHRIACDAWTHQADSVFAKLAGGRRKQSSVQLAQQTGLDAGLFTLQKMQTQPLKLKQAAGTV